jgi:hypothetical protein
MKNVNTIIETELTNLDRGIVATPDEDYLDRFTDANHGSNDFLLVQMAKQYGYKLALLAIREQLNTK